VKGYYWNWIDQVGIAAKEPCLKVWQWEKFCVIVTTRSKRSGWGIVRTRRQKDWKYQVMKISSRAFGGSWCRIQSL